MVNINFFNGISDLILNFIILILISVNIFIGVNFIIKLVI